MQVIINGKNHTLPDSCNLANALQQLGYTADMPFAVAVNNTVIPKQDHPHHTISGGSTIEILMPMQGG
jgi:sulfur carrier protein